MITSVASPEKPEGFAPKGLVCGFVRVNRPLENGTKLTLADPRRKIQVETVTDIRPARTARMKLGSRLRVVNRGGEKDPLLRKGSFSLPRTPPLILLGLLQWGWGMSEIC